MKIGIFGMGGIGGYYGAMLARHYAGREEHQFYFIARGKHLEAMRQNGLRLLTPKEEFTVRPTLATDQPAECGILDLVLLCTKTYHLDDAARQLAPVVGENTVILTVLNGVDNAERLRAHFPQAQVLNGGVYISATLIEPGVVRHNGGAGRTLLGSESGEHERYRWIENFLKEAGIPAEYHEDITWAVWEKYLFIEPMGSATSYKNTTFGGLRDTPESWQLVDGLLGELERVAAAQGIALPEGIHQATLNKYLSFPPETKTSMQVDFEKGGQTEIETFTGYVVRAGHRLGVAVPLHEQVYAALKK